MKIFTTKNNFFKLIGILFWLIIWYIISQILNQNILLVSPVDVIKKLFKLLFEKEFYFSILNSFFTISIGFFLAVFLGIFLASISYKFKILTYFVDPIISVIKSVPVMSFIILSLLFLKAKNISIFISFLISLPIIYTNVYSGLLNTDKKLLEMAFVFDVSKFKKITYIYITQVFPYFVSSCKISIGLSFKSGIAAEVIGLPKNTIGTNLFYSKVYLNTDDLFAWTIVIVIVSFIFEKFIIFLLDKIMLKLQRI